MSNQTIRRLNWANITSIVSLLVALLSAFFSWQANSISKRANELIEKQNNLIQQAASPNISVKYVISYVDRNSAPNFMCIAPYVGPHWEMPFVVLFDITNEGGKAVSLTNVGQIPSYDATPIFHTAYFDFFGSADSFDQWYEGHKQGAYDLEYGRITEDFFKVSKSAIDFSAPPINVPSGETRRLVLLGMQILTSLAPTITTHQQASNALNSYHLQTIVQFLFADGSSQYVVIPVYHPYVSEASAISEPFEKCS